MTMKLFQGDCVSILKDMPDNSVDSIVTDPPYGLSAQKREDIEQCLFSWSQHKKYEHGKKGFKGNTWDGWVPDPETWRECYRVLKHGGHIAAFASPRTSDLMSISMRLAGFECRDVAMWVFGSGVPKGNNIAIALEKEMKKIGISDDEIAAKLSIYDDNHILLKPAYEPILIFRKPLDGTVAQNIIKYGTGVLNTKSCRIPDSLRFPSNFIHDGSPDVLSLFPNSDTNQIQFGNTQMVNKHYKDHGSAARFFYCAKASRKDREEGLDAIESTEKDFIFRPSEGQQKTAKNIHPTVKPMGVMQYLCRLVTPENGTILDPFMGSGSTGKATAQEGFSFIGIEREDSYFTIAENRINHAYSHNNNSQLFQ